MARWPHGPSRVVNAPGAYFLTVGTYRKERLFNTPEKLTMLEDALLAGAEEFEWELQAWAVFSNHYHFVAIAPGEENRLSEYIAKLHTCTSRELNRLDHAPGRKVWHQFRDTCLTYERSYYARLAYVHNNPVKHGLVSVPEQYPWCSAEWFRQRAEPSFYETVHSFKTDRVKVYDDY